MKSFSGMLWLILFLFSLCSNQSALPDIPPQEFRDPSYSEAASPALPDAFPMEFTFASGAGGWGTVLTLNPDGTFAGFFHDSDMGDTGDGYPNGTVYVCVFEGRFENIAQADEYTYTMTLGEMQTEAVPGDVWIEDGIRYIASDPYGISEGYAFTLYLPDTPLDTLSEDFLMWWPYRYSQSTDQHKTLSCYGILNIDTGYGFFSDY